MSRTFGYARALSTDQRAQAQVSALETVGCAQVFVDGLSRSIECRPELERLLAVLGPGDTLVVCRLDRLALSLQTLADHLQSLDARGIGFRSLDESLDASGANRATVVHVVAALARFERDLLSERVRPGPGADQVSRDQEEGGADLPPPSLPGPQTTAGHDQCPRERPAASSGSAASARTAERWQILRYHVEQGVTLAALARETGLAYRTLQRWDARFRSGGVPALDDRQRADAGTRRLPATIVSAIEALARSKPEPTVTSMHRRITARCLAEGTPPPSYSTVRSIARAAGRTPGPPSGR